MAFKIYNKNKIEDKTTYVNIYHIEKVSKHKYFQDVATTMPTAMLCKLFY